MAAFKAFWNSPVGPKTTHFWGPIANWGFVAAGLVDMQKPPEMISGNMTAVTLIYQIRLLRTCHLTLSSRSCYCDHKLGNQSLSSSIWAVVAL
ncbi:mitochondrial pyruvate carrier 1 isoform X1 [Canna indica]|uniref:Mitochondrial pyruvate carrier n=1 Tax=Canna indica TaxID=4628 RepID=A0AAQ3KDJ5_9LILI|nr:mitochondrial pyruvate carrier 1 isoform X1 [Canna indica]